MPERLIRARRPVGWNQLLRKGHAHVSRNSGRGAGRRALAGEVEDALDELAGDVEEALPDADELPAPPQTRR